MKLIEDALGDTTEGLFEVQGLGTVPGKQGHGYATALINVVHEMVHENLWDGRNHSRFVFIAGGRAGPSHICTNWRCVEILRVGGVQAHRRGLVWERQPKVARTPGAHSSGQYLVSA